MWSIVAAKGVMMEELRKLAHPHNKAVVNPVAEDDMESRLVTRQRIEDLEAAMCQGIAEDELEEFDDSEFLTHHFIEGVYARELVIPADMAVVGRLHKYPRICIISGGDVSFVTEFGSRRVQAPFTEVMPPGTKTALYTHTKTTWTAIHGTHETDIKKLEQIFTERNHEQLTHDERRRLG